MDKQQSGHEISSVISNAMRPATGQRVEARRTDESNGGEASASSRVAEPNPRLEKLKSLLNGEMLLIVLSILLALGFFALAASNVTNAGSFFTIDSLFLTLVCVTLGGIFLAIPALTLKEKGMLKNPFADRADAAPAIIEENIHFEGSTKMFLSVLGGLLVLTVVEVLLAYFEVPLVIMLTVLIGLSLIKAALIMAYFMHLRFERMSLVLTLVPILVICICLLFILFPDSLRAGRLRTNQTATTTTTTTEHPASTEH